MKYTYTCKKVTLNDSIKDYAEKKISKLERYFREDDTSASVTFSVEKDHLCTVEITIRGAGPLLRAQTQAPDGDMRGAIESAVGYIERQILKNKTRLSKRLRSEGFPAPAASDDFEVPLLARHTWSASLLSAGLYQRWREDTIRNSSYTLRTLLCLATCRECRQSKHHAVR